MFGLFNKRNPEPPQDVKAIRELLLAGIKGELQKLEGGEGNYIKGLTLFMTCLPAEKYKYESAVFAEDEGKFKNEVQRIADDFAIDLPAGWTLQVSFVGELPEDAIKLAGLTAALSIRTPEHQVVTHAKTAYIRPLNGEAEKNEYKINASDGKINIGREHQVQVSDGFFRINHIAFPDASQHEANKFISRQHAHIEWDADTESFLLFADEGGIPPRNKVKIRSLGEHSPVKLNVAELGHQLQEGDQIILGELAVLEFSYIDINHN